LALIMASSKASDPVYDLVLELIAAFYAMVAVTREARSRSAAPSPSE